MYCDRESALAVNALSTDLIHCMDITFANALCARAAIAVRAGPTCQWRSYTSHRRIGLIGLRAPQIIIRDAKKDPVASVEIRWSRCVISVCVNGEWKRWAVYKDSIWGIAYVFFGRVVLCEASGAVVGYLVPPALHDQVRSFFVPAALGPYRFYALDAARRRIGCIELFRGGITQAITKCEYRSDRLAENHQVTSLHLLAVVLDLVHKLSTCA